MKNLEITSKRQSVTIYGTYENHEFSFYYDVNGDSVDGMSFIWLGEAPECENLEVLETEIQQQITQQ